MDNQHIRVRFGIDEIGDGLGAGLDRPVRVAGFKNPAPALHFALQIGGPALRQVEAHGHRHQGHALAVQRGGIGRRTRIFLGYGGNGQGQHGGGGGGGKQ